MGTLTRFLILLALLGGVQACGSDNPFDEDQVEEEPADDGEEPTDEEDGGGVDSSLELPPGTAEPTASSAIARYEPRSEDDDFGGGYAENFVYNSATDTFEVDNLPLDGDNVYARDDTVGTINSFAVYENKEQVLDPATGKPIPQHAYKMLYKVSASGGTEVALVRTASYADHGFGGWTYERNDGHGVNLPVSLQATFSGDYAGLRTFNGASGMQYVVGSMTMNIDWDDFNGEATQDAIDGRVTNRRLFDLNGNDITQAYIDNLSTEAEATQVKIPDLLFEIGPNTIDQNGEFAGVVFSRYTNGDGQSVILEQGTYSGVFAGDGSHGPTEAAGVMVLDHDHPNLDGVAVKETGGFIVTR